MEKLYTPMAYLKGVGPAKAELLASELGIFRFIDLLFHLPFRYVDKSQVSSIRDLNPDSGVVVLRGRIRGFSLQGHPRSRRLKAVIEDDTGILELVWFKGAQWMEKYLKKDAEYVVYGKLNEYRGKLSIAHPELDLVTGNKVPSALRGIYPSTEKLKTKGLDSKGLEKLVHLLLENLDSKALAEILPQEILSEHELIDREQAIRSVHFPPDTESLEAARRRMKFEEFLMIQLALIISQQMRRENFEGYKLTKIDNVFDRFFHEKLAFELTGAQKRVLKEIRQDVLSGQQMNRLLQGDVGSGKTIVALMAMLMAVDNGLQAAIMAPTEILAQQHMQSISEMLPGLGVQAALLTGSVKGKERKQLLTALKTGHLHILIGTHALIEDHVQFEKLGLVVIDEQHRFGVAQRARLWAKGEIPPHMLVMTATPIPRTLAMTLYGDLDTSVIDELPPGRKPVKTVHRRDPQRLSVFGFLKEQIELGGQAYIVYPLIEESEKLDYKDLMDGYESVRRAFPEMEVSIVHGRMKSDAKDMEMQRFASGKTQIMVATTVIEVGVNVPNASIMIIESAERFGLSQLHQLRGRVGRGADQSYCILMTKDKLSNDARTRIKTMCQTNDGFKISEVDMRLRGPGDISGTRQSGMLQLKVGDLIEDKAIIEEARSAARSIVAEDPKLETPKYQGLAEFMWRERKNKKDWSRIG
jgi:ATP-dependent DNA helicase RecG